MTIVGLNVHIRNIKIKGFEGQCNSELKKNEKGARYIVQGQRLLSYTDSTYSARIPLVLSRNTEPPGISFEHSCVWPKNAT